jgi:SAM-dependent methyltransferase
MSRHPSKARSIDNPTESVAEGRLDDRTAAVYKRILSASQSPVLQRTLRRTLHQKARFERRLKVQLPRWRRGRDGAPPGAEPVLPEEWSRAVPGQDPEPLIDVKQLLAHKSVEELGERAEAYFQATLHHPDPLLAKPVASVAEAPELLISFGTLLRGLQPLPGATVLDFGAGSCWTSRLLAQLGCRVIAMDISPAALDLGRLLFERNPVFGQTFPVQFLVFDGRHIELGAETVDYIVCFDAFHHVPNPEEVLGEMARVLRPGGTAAFSEPGPQHSRLPQSQYEMRNFGVIENDIVMSDLTGWAERAGFDDVRLAIFDADTYWCSPTEFDSLWVPFKSQADYVSHLRTSLYNRRLFVLKRRGSVSVDSRDRTQLRCALELTALSIDPDAQPGEVIISGSCRAVNTGTARWLPSDSELAPVRLGARWRTDDRATQDLARFPLPGDGLDAGESCEIPFRLVIPSDLASSGSTKVEIDLVSEGVTWFAINGSTPLQVWPALPRVEFSA